MKKLSIALKVLSKIVGGFCIIYGFIVGVLGTGPDGPHGSLWIHIIGIYIILLGLSYFYPNSRLATDNKKKTLYFIFTASPVVVLIVVALYSAITDGIDALIRQDVHIQFPVFLLLASFAPLSLITYKKEETFNQSIQATGRGVGPDGQAYWPAPDFSRYALGWW